ncbi:MAG: prepilin-type N-terminal cleavage/methylation domain-containing protein [Verrucomicrobiales bacterium]
MKSAATAATRLASRRPGGFTVVELVVTAAIIAILSLVGFAGYSMVVNRARMAAETAAARNLGTAYQLYANDHNRELMPGYQEDPDATNLEGDPLYSPVNARYPWRLAPYIGSLEGTLLYNGNQRFLDGDNRDYMVSVSPNMGINANFVGGHFGNSALVRPGSRMESRLGKFYVSRLGQAENLIVFASARSDSGPGYFEVQPPKAIGEVWSSQPFDPDAPASKHGFVDFRWNGQAIVSMLDGSVAPKSEEQLRDMRLWCQQAAVEDDPDFTLGGGSR